MILTDTFKLKLKLQNSKIHASKDEINYKCENFQVETETKEVDMI